MKLSPTQRGALALLAVKPFVRTIAGWHHAGHGLAGHSSQTMTALADRGLVKIALDRNRKHHWIARITEAGRRAVAPQVEGDAA